MSASDLLLVPLLLPLAAAITEAAVPPRARGWVALLACVLTAVAGAALLAAVRADGPIVYRVGGWEPPFGIVLVADLLGAMLALLTATVASAAALHALLWGDGYASNRFYHPLFLLLLMALGGVFLTGDLFNLYVFMELAILSSFPLVALAGRAVSAEATWKYAVLSALGSSLLLVGVALVYASMGTLNLADIAVRRAAGAGAPFDSVAAAVLLFVFLLKAAVFPLHFWQPDAHSAAPAPISAMLSGMLVKVGVYGIIRLQTLIFPDAAVLALLGPLGAVSAVFGGLAAVANRDLKRMLAYSTISNMGFVVVALAWGGALGLLAALVHTVNHALIKSGLFLSGGYVAERVDEHGMDRLGGVAGLSPGTAAVFGVGAVALAGLPPANGFLSKFALLRAGIDAGDPVSLAAVVAASALGLAYPLVAFVRVFWGRSPAAVRRRWRQRRGRRSPLIAAAALAVVCLVLGLWPGPLFSLAQATAEELADPAAYITAVLERE